MTAHVLARELDDSVPATLSPRVVDGLDEASQAFSA